MAGVFMALPIHTNRKNRLVNLYCRYTVWLSMEERRLQVTAVVRAGKFHVESVDGCNNRVYKAIKTRNSAQTRQNMVGENRIHKGHQNRRVDEAHLKHVDVGGVGGVIQDPSKGIADVVVAQHQAASAVKQPHLKQECHHAGCSERRCVDRANQKCVFGVGYQNVVDPVVQQEPGVSDVLGVGSGAEVVQGLDR
ncbi:hypothetical protein CANTEDRAFT_116072 [Yamadazyma tenuis ATCC 10573]|uniref:Uncharacterized protein n=1 Tax=Candida tenuis (strain ATCC 10573 / BCRC 21748 / CBS 615 / JCM 9827 / NBRC 10315 / NRRL Y-1498 / VKM Y-70) TaxID=590646 RepID=G3BFL4_CANTC|nr:uncharacterized protein CANTEDRAFT_116072 [Yamadazyma tenuis ATCC 10573]EGV60045.1 hypothetical protein CANTEDRAFT_116072 [Yamadazyma tenuis ATCC 10573]